MSREENTVSSESRHLSGTKEGAGMETLVGRSGARLPDGSVVKNLAAMQKTQETQVPSPGRDDSHGGKNGNPTPVFLPGESHGQRSLACYSPWYTIHGILQAEYWSE